MPLVGSATDSPGAHRTLGAVRTAPLRTVAVPPGSRARRRAGACGAGPAEALAPVRIAAAQAVPLPLGETALANWLLATAGQLNS